MRPLDHAESADQDKGVCDGMADCCPGSHRHCARRGISRSVCEPVPVSACSARSDRTDRPAQQALGHYGSLHPRQRGQHPPLPVALGGPLARAGGQSPPDSVHAAADQTPSSSRRDALVVIDATLCDHVGSLFDHVDRHDHHGDGTYPLAHHPVTSFSVSGPVRFPLGLRLYRRDEA